MLEVDGLVKRYKTKDRKVVEAVKGIGFSLEAGRILAFLGPNGAGKTTTIKMIAGLINPDEGDVTVNGYSVSGKPKEALREIGAVLEGSRNLYWRLTPLENFEYWAGIRGVSRKVARERGRELMSELGLENKLGSTVQQLSRGMQQQVAICAALIHTPSLLLLDEPTLGLDLDASDRIQEYVLKLAHERGVGIVLTTHQMEIAQALADYVSIIQSGTLTLEGLKSEVLERYAGRSYLFELGAVASVEVRRKVEARGGVWSSKVEFRVVLDDPTDIYDLMRVLEPTAIVKMVRETADLAMIFREHTRMASASEEALRGVTS
ncbi:ABC transporter ATP-binding protein [Sulfoacidibacillus thermotolerans]|uniref:ABC transporter ATP-binding protein n=1 Tax=Sulfoacidibacillus thermotolerans TaxID=1765684 RepID=UPI0015E8185E|nr:ABC transporter ATP-binding protein [Sulfoacidibacillus thermotolerans]